MQDILSQLRSVKYNSIVIYGATASGKSAFALDLANKLQDAIIINADSMQVYKEIPIITAQPQDLIDHHLYGFVSCKCSSFSVSRWLSLVSELMKNSSSIPIIVGGTGMYISSLINGLSQMPTVPNEVITNVTEQYNLYGLQYLKERLTKVDPITASKISDKQRTIRALSVYEATGKAISSWQESNYKYVDTSEMMKIWIKPDRDILYERINKRFVKMIENGAIEEVQSLIKNYPDVEELPKAIGLREIIQYIECQLSKDEMISKAQQLTRNYAKRQETWFKNQLTHDFII